MSDTEDRQNYRIVTNDDGFRRLEWLEDATLAQLVEYGAAIDRRTTVESVTVVGLRPVWEITAKEHDADIVAGFSERIVARSLPGAIAAFRETYEAADWEIVKVEEVG